MERQRHGVLVHAFNSGSDAERPRKAPTDDFSKRPPVPEREGGDLSGDALTAYINGLESRLVGHMRKHAPQWHDKETRKTLNRWDAPFSRPPAPNWAAPRDTFKDARDYAAMLLKERLVARMNRLGDIRVARYLGGHKQVDPLHLIFHEKSTVPDRKHRHKL